MNTTPLGLGIAAAAVFALCIAACDGDGLDDELVVIDRSVYEKAPDFVLPSLRSGEVALSESAGSVRVINFWATWCAPCREEMPSLETVVVVC